MADSENSEGQEVMKTERKRLCEATRKQLKIGPKALPPGTPVSGFDPSQWQKYEHNYRRGIAYSFTDVLPFFWCRISLSLVTIADDILLVHFSFENLYDGVLPLNLEESLFVPSDVRREWLKEDITSVLEVMPAPTSKLFVYRGDVNHDLQTLGKEANLFLPPSQTATVTRRVIRNEDGSWTLPGFGDCLSGHSYRFQLLYGGLPSNVVHLGRTR